MVVATWRRPAALEQCLAALARQERAPDEVVVVARPDDEPTHRVLDRVQETDLPLNVAPVTIPGVIAAMDTGRQAATGDIVVFTDDDAVPDADWLARIDDHFAGDPRLGAVGGRDRLAGNQDPPIASDRVGQILPYGRRVGEHHHGEGPAVDADVLKGVNIAFRRPVLDAVGFDPRLRGRGAQPHWEVSTCLGVKRAGWKVLYDPSVVVDHNEGPRYNDTERGYGDLSELGAATHNATYGMVRYLPAGKEARGARLRAAGGLA